jgi:hypothetical protein
VASLKTERILLPHVQVKKQGAVQTALLASKFL